MGISAPIRPITFGLPQATGVRVVALVHWKYRFTFTGKCCRLGLWSLQGTSRANLLMARDSCMVDYHIRLQRPSVSFLS